MTNFSYQLKQGIERSGYIFIFFIYLFTLVNDGTPLAITNKKQSKYIA